MDRGLYAQLRKLDRHDLRRVLMFVRGLLLSLGDDVGPAAPGEATVTYRQEAVRCGKPGCTRCPHGPYWYGYYREGGRLKKHYIGRRLPEEIERLQGQAP